MPVSANCTGTALSLPPPRRRHTLFQINHVGKQYSVLENGMIIVFREEILHSMGILKAALSVKAQCRWAVTCAGEDHAVPFPAAKVLNMADERRSVSPFLKAGVNCDIFDLKGSVMKLDDDSLTSRMPGIIIQDKHPSFINIFFHHLRLLIAQQQKIEKSIPLIISDFSYLHDLYIIRQKELSGKPRPRI